MPKSKVGIDMDSTNQVSKKQKKVVVKIDTNTPPSEDYPSQLTNKEFTATDFSSLAENEHARYAPNSKKIGHAVITKEDNQTIALQYEIPAAGIEGTPTVRPLINIEAIEPFRGMHRFRAQTPTGHTPMYAKRFISGRIGEGSHEESIQIACFSPSDKAGKPPFWGSMKETPLFSDTLSKSAKKELEKELAEIGQVFKGGDALQVDHASVPQRDLMKTRTPDQNTVMGESARDAYEHFFEKMTEELHPHMKERLKRSFQAELRDHFFKNSYRPEWLHLKGWSLTPIGMNPQTQDNLGAAPKWTNTQMMVLERIVKWFAINSPESLLSIKPKFEMLLDSEVVKHIDFSVKIQIKERYVELMQSIDPFLAFPLFPKASDLAQGAAVTYNILNHINPVSKQAVKGPTLKEVGVTKGGPSILAQNQITKMDTEELGVMKKHEVQEETLKQFKGGSGESKSHHMSEQSSLTKIKPLPTDDLSDEESVIVHKKKRSKFPTQNRYERSVVQIYSDFFTPDYDTPWKGAEIGSCSGSGFIVQDDLGKKYIMTNAHVAENTTFLQVRLANSRIKKYEAKVTCVSYQADLALLEVDDPEFNDLVNPVELGDMVNLRDKIMVVGFPMGGSEISLSKGIVSRIEVDTYAESMDSLLQAQVDAAVNPGNSGGPVFMGDKVVGVAFQGLNGHQGLSYIIPMPIVKHFLTEVFSGKPYRGYPSIPVVVEEIENPSEREFYNMNDRSGIRVLKVDNLCDAYSKLKRDDILLAIDGLVISNEGTVDIPGVGSCINFSHVTQSKFIGDSVRLEVLRKIDGVDAVEELTVDVVLDTILGDTEKVSVPEHDKMPTFYINSGICFVPLTRNYLDGSGADYESMQLVEENCALPDVPKKNPNEQFVVINTIFNSKQTHGYDKHINSLVKEINGTAINTIHDVVRAMEGNDGKRHVISLASKSKIVIPNMSAEEHTKLLKRNHIPQDRSVDLVALGVGKEPSLSHPQESELYVEHMELTQSGMHALFARMGYSDLISGSIYNGKPIINTDALNKQGFMPVLADVGENKASGHWIMLIKGLDHKYFIFDPLGQASGRSYVDGLASQLPKGAVLAVIPNADGFNNGLCGYWVASNGIRAHAALNQKNPDSLTALGQTMTLEMATELANNGFEDIIKWLESVTQRFTGKPAQNPIDARTLRQEQTPLRVVRHAMAERPSFFEPIKEQAKAHAKRKRVIESDEESVEEIQLTRDMLPGLKRYEEKLNEMWARHKDDSENQDDDEDDDDYVNSSNEADCSDEEETLSDEQSTELMDSQSDDSSVELDATNKNSKPASLLHRRGFFKPLSVAVDTNREQDQRQARLN